MVDGGSRKDAGCLDGEDKIILIEGIALYIPKAAEQSEGHASVELRFSVAKFLVGICLTLLPSPLAFQSL